jgi:PBSX family phage terminase large subunit
MSYRNGNGQFKKGNPGGALKMSNFNRDRPMSIAEEVITETIKVIKTPLGTEYERPKRMLLRDWVKEAFQALLVMGGFYSIGNKFVRADNPADHVHINHILTTADRLKKLSITDIQYLAKYKRDGLLENPQLSLIKKHFKQCKNFCSILDVYHPYFAMLGWQREAINRKEFITIYTGGRGRGGSFVAIPKTLLTAMTSDYPKTLTIGRKDKASNRTSTFVDALAFLMVPEFAMMLQKPPNRSTMQIDFRNGSSVIFVGYHTEQQRAGTKGVGASDKVGGGAAGATLEEVTDGITEHDFHTIQTNVRGVKDGQIIMSMNPGPPNHWVKRDIIDNELIETTPAGGRIVKFSKNRNAIIYNKTAKDNEWLMQNDPDYWEQLLAINSPTLQKRLAHGLWISAEGAVYSEFDLSEHVKQFDFDIMEKLASREGFSVIGYDGGARDASVVIWAYITLKTERITNKYSRKTWEAVIYRQFYMKNCNRSHIDDMVASFPDSRKAKMLIGGHDCITEIDSIEKKGIRAKHNKDKNTVGDMTKEHSAELVNVAFGEGRLLILKDSLLNNDRDVSQELKLKDWQPPAEGEAVSIQTELPGIIWEKKKRDGVEAETGKIQDGNDDASDALNNIFMYVQNYINKNNAANAIKGLKVLAGLR